MKWLAMHNELLPWHIPSWLSLIHTFHAKSLSNALLLYGNIGANMDVFGNIFCKKILCEKNDLYPCSICRSCLWFEQNQHPDFIALPEENGKSISIDSIRNIQTFSHVAPTGSYKVVLCLADVLTIQATNALLKIVEEPFEKLMFVFMTTKQGAMLPTLNSRCVKVQIPDPKPEEILALLERQGIDAALANFFLLLASGTGLAFQFAQKEWPFFESILADLVSLIKKTALPGVIAEKWSKDSPQDCLYFLYCFFVLLARQVNMESLHLPVSYEVTHYFKTLKSKDYLALASHWIKMYKNITLTSGKLAYNLEKLLIHWQTIQR